MDYKIKKIAAGVDSLLERIADKSEPFYSGQAVGLNYVKALLQDTFPELKESEDERIRKEIVSFIKSVNHSYLCGADRRTKWLTWLEKKKEQKEQKDYRKLYEEVVKSDWFKENYVGKSLGDDENQKEQKPNLLPGFEGLSPDEEMSHPLFLKGFDVGRKVGHIEAEHTYSTEETELNSVAFLEQLGYTCIPPNEQKPAEWSEEDESFLDSVEEAISNYYDLNHAPQYHYWLEEKLKSPRPQPHWKPSEEQMDALLFAVGYVHGNEATEIAAILESLYDDLKKLIR